jgi:transcriptional regulator with XRE-family HTH domain
MENYINEYLGENLKTLRESNNNMKQSEVAVLFGVTQQYYSKIECGKINFTNEILNNICSVFNITPNDFINCRTKITELKFAESQQADKDLIAQLQWQIQMQNLYRADLEIEVRKYRKNFIVGDDGPPVHVLI